jgi:hypothetical protein
LAELCSHACTCGGTRLAITAVCCSTDDFSRLLHSRLHSVTSILVGLGLQAERIALLHPIEIRASSPKMTADGLSSLALHGPHGEDAQRNASRSTHERKSWIMGMNNSNFAFERKRIHRSFGISDRRIGLAIVVDLEPGCRLVQAPPASPMTGEQASTILCSTSRSPDWILHQ